MVPSNIEWALDNVQYGIGWVSAHLQRELWHWGITSSAMLWQPHGTLSMQKCSAMPAYIATIILVPNHLYSSLPYIAEKQYWPSDQRGDDRNG